MASLVNEFYQMLKKEITSNLYKLFQKVRKRDIRLAYPPTKPDKDTTGKLRIINLHKRRCKIP